MSQAYWNGRLGYKWNNTEFSASQFRFLYSVKKKKITGQNILGLGSYINGKIQYNIY